MVRINCEELIISTRGKTLAPAFLYSSSAANDLSPAVGSTNTSTFFFTSVATASGRSDTLVSWAGSLNMPIVIILFRFYVQVFRAEGRIFFVFSPPEPLFHKMKSKTNGEMLLFFEFMAQQGYANKEQINSASDRRIFFDFLPGLFHLLTPVNVIQDKNGIIICLCKQLTKIIYCGSVTVITIHKCKIYCWQLIKNSRQGIIKITFNQFYVGKLEGLEI